MPRQISNKKMRGNKSRGSSPIPQTRRRPKMGKAVSRRPIEDGAINSIAKMTKSMSKSGMIAEVDKNSSMKDASRTIMSAIGAGVIDEIEPDSVSKERGKKKVKLKTSYSLLQTETDREVIPNSNIVDIKSVKNQFTATPMVSARKIFRNFEEDTIFSPKPQETIKETFKRQQMLKAKQTSNLIDIAGHMIEFQSELKSDTKLQTFRFTQKKLVNTLGDNTNYEFKDFSDPNIHWDDDSSDET